MDYYNYGRTHQGYKLKGNGYITPAEGHLSEKSKNLTKELGNNKIKIVMVDKRKGVGEKSILADDFIKTRSEKEEVLAYQIVTTS